MGVSLSNAYRHADNYTVESADGMSFLGVERNAEEAEAIATWATHRHGRKYVVVRNSRDAVRAARLLAPSPIRFRYREDALKEMGVWS